MQKLKDIAGKMAHHINGNFNIPNCYFFMKLLTGLGWIDRILNELNFGGSFLLFLQCLITLFEKYLRSKDIILHAYPVIRKTLSFSRWFFMYFSFHQCSYFIWILTHSHIWIIIYFRCQPVTANSLFWGLLLFLLA